VEKTRLIIGAIVVSTLVATFIAGATIWSALDLPQVVWDHELEQYVTKEEVQKISQKVEQVAKDEQETRSISLQTYIRVMGRLLYDMELQKREYQSRNTPVPISLKEQISSTQADIDEAKARLQQLYFGE